MRKIYLSIILFFGFINIYSQTSPNTDIALNKNSIYIGFGVSYSPEIKINATLNSNKLQQINSIDLPTTLGVNYFKNRLGINSEIIINGGLLNSDKTRLSAIIPRLGVSYILLNKPDFNFGINLNYSYVSAFGKIYYQTDNVISSTNLTNSNGGLIEINNTSHNTGIFLFVNFLTGKRTSLFKIGYDYSLTNYSWQITNNKSTDFPKEKFDKLYITYGFILNKSK